MFEIKTRTDCSYCQLAKSLLQKRGLAFEETVLDDADERKAFLGSIDAHTLPQIYENGSLVGGYEDLLVMVQPSTLTRFNEAYKPFRHAWAVDITVRHEKTHWIEDEVDLTEDMLQWKGDKMSRVNRDFITNILRLFTQLDVAVGQNYCDQFIPVFKNNEVRNMLLSFASREGTHQRAYALLNETLGLPDDEYDVFLDYREMADKVSFMMASDVSTPTGVALALAKSVFNEGVSLFASFLMLLHFQRFGEMKGMGKVVEWSVRDETIHVEGISTLFNRYLDDNPRICTTQFEKSVVEMVKSIVLLETKFVELAYRIGPIDGLAKEDVVEFIKYIADRRLLQIKFDPVFDVTRNPVEWIDWVLNGADHTNFFENRVTEYEVAGITGTWEGVYE